MPDYLFVLTELGILALVFAVVIFAIRKKSSKDE